MEFTTEDLVSTVPYQATLNNTSGFGVVHDSTTENNESPTSQGNRTLGNLVLETVTFCIMWLSAVFGNSLVCVVIYRSRRLQSTTNYFVVSLAIADLSFTVFCMPFVLARILSDQWAVGSIMCKIVRFLQIVVPGCSMYVLLSICVDRFYTIIYPLSFKITRGRAKRMVIGSLLFTMVISCPCFYFYDVIKIEDRPFCRTYVTSTPHGMVYIILCVILVYVTPIIAMLVGYVRIFKYVWRAGVGGRTFQRTTNPVPRAKVKMVKMLVIVNVMVLLLYGPFLITQIVFCVNKLAENYANPTIYIAVLWVMFSSVVAKPVLYICYNSNFRRGCKEVFCMSTMKCYRTSAYTITTASALSRKNYVGVVDCGREHQRLDSPSKTFDRSAMVDKTIWPLSNQTPSTYL